MCGISLERQRLKNFLWSAEDMAQGKMCCNYFVFLIWVMFSSCPCFQQEGYAPPSTQQAVGAGYRMCSAAV